MKENDQPGQGTGAASISLSIRKVAFALVIFAFVARCGYSQTSKEISSRDSSTQAREEMLAGPFLEAEEENQQHREFYSGVGTDYLNMAARQKKADDWEARELQTKSTKAPSSKSTKAPTSKSTKAPSSKSTKAPTTVSTKAPTSKSTKAPTTVSTKAPTSKSTKAPTTVSTKAPTSKSTKAPTSKSTKAPTTKGTK